MRPLFDYVILTRIDPPEDKAALIVSPGTVKTSGPAHGVIEATGPKADAVTPNDLVMFNLYAGTQIPGRGPERYLVKQGDITAVLEEGVDYTAQKQPPTEAAPTVLA